ncbi:MAG: hypothetical protein ACTSQK_11770 [Candidatus Heimdallarchaeota archaeon]
MTHYIGIRRETKHGERRTPLVPSAVTLLKEKYDIQTILQPHETRAFSDEEYEKSGGIIKEDLSECPVIFGIKEMETDIFTKGGAYMCFHHVIKGQSDNMPMLKYLMDTGCTIFDYEKVVNDKNHRLIFFGRHAGYAGMIDTLHGFGLRLQAEGFDTPFLKIKQACDYFDLKEAKEEIAKVKDLIANDGLPEELCPIVFGFLGYVNVSQGAQSILEILPVKEIAPDDLAKVVENPDRDECKKIIYKVVFKEEHMVKPIGDHKFELQDYYKHPEKYEGVFSENYLRYLAVIVNGAYWSAKYPKSVTKQELKELFSDDSPPRLRFVGDISCDIEGGFEGTLRISYIDRPYYVFDPFKNTATDGVKGKGPVILAIDHLPTEIPRDASEYFSGKLMPFVPEITKADFTGSFADVELSDDVKRSVILWQGKFTSEFEYIGDFLKK